MHVLIIGAGPTGLLIAQGLRKNGIPFTIFEKAEHERKRNWAVTLHWRMPVVRSLLPRELAARLDEAQTNPWEPVPAEKEEIFVRNGATGQAQYAIPIPGTREMNVEKMKTLFSEGGEVQVGIIICTRPYLACTHLMSSVWQSAKRHCRAGGRSIRRSHLYRR